MNNKTVDTKSLVSMERLDIGLKILYIDEYVNSRGDKYKNLYKQHIEHRTAYLEDNKSIAEDFFISFNSLIDSIRNNGFDEYYPITVSSVNGINLTGAHRLACALYLNIEKVPIIIESTKGLVWGRSWFEKYHFPQCVIEELELVLLGYLKTSTFIVWNPLYQKFSDILLDIKSEANILIEREITLQSDKNLIDIVNDIYAYELGPSVSSIIEEKGVQLSSYNPNIIKLIVTSGISELEMLSLKNKIRNKYNEIVNKDLYITIHSSDDVEHSKYLYSLMLSNNNLSALKKRNGVSKNLSMWLDELYEYCNINNINRNDLCIVGSSSMDVFGIRQSTDIDFILKHEIRESRFTTKVHELTPNIDLACEGYLRLALKSITDDMVINNHSHHFFYRGFKFISLEDVLARKKVQCREKDISDARLIESWLCDSRKRQVRSKLKFLFWKYFVARPKYYKTRIKFVLRQYLPNSLIEFIKRVLK